MKATYLQLASALVLTFGIAACVPSTPAPAPAAPAPVSRPAPVSAAPPQVAQVPDLDTWMEAAVTPGTWRYSAVNGGSTAEFLSPANDRIAAIYCSYGREVFLAVYRADEGPITIRSETAARTQIANLSGAFARTILSPNDPLLDAMALSKGRFAVEAQGLPPLILPSWAEVSRVIEDCR
jgi:hypothetical protein